MTFRMQSLADRTAPRYTSYPTAPHFAADIGGDHYAAWLGTLPAHARLSLYLHVPFCEEICYYCGCHTKAVRRRGPVDAYAERLKQELRIVGDAAVARRVANIHWGGGTPSILGAESLHALHQVISETFELLPDVEHAIELDPRRVTSELIGTLALMGVNRASLGVQDFSPHVQAAAGRLQPFEMVEGAVNLLRRYGIERINLDLMYGLPCQSVDDIQNSIALAVSLKPQRVALFGYAHVPWFKANQRQIDASALACSSERLEQAEIGRELLIASGYHPIGLDHFALPDDELAEAARSGRLRRNFQGYTTDQADALLGFGASAIGRLPEGFVQNAPDHAGYARSIDAGRLATVRGLALTKDDLVRGRIIEDLMCRLEADAGAVWERDDGLAGAPAREQLAPYVEEGLVRVDGSRVVVTDLGRPFVRLIAAAFDARLANSQPRHSAAI
jgi:oxygen-independent coproporphyrinogen-3 oxidase